MVKAPALDSTGLATAAPDPSGGMALECIDVVKRFGHVEAVSGLNLAVERGSILALLGPSGCGKTTTLRLIAGFEWPDSGRISIGGRVVSSQHSSLPPEKRRIGMVFQEGALFPHLTVEQNVGYGLRKDPDRPSRIDDALDLVGLSGMRQRLPHELSGGQQQRVALARALAPNPDILLMDEPFSNLDAKLREQLQRDVVDILHACGVTAVFVTHDQQAALGVGDQVAVMNEGMLEQTGSPAALFHAPDSRFVARFIGEVDFIPARIEEGQLTSELGTVGSNGHIHGPSLGPVEAAPKFGHETATLEGRLLELMIRPDCIECFADEEGQAVIVGREFQGAFYLYRLRLPSGQEVRCLLPHIADFPVGGRVSVQMRDGHQARLFIDGRRAGSINSFN